jgi:hypothetical protein
MSKHKINTLTTTTLVTYITLQSYRKGRMKKSKIKLYVYIAVGMVAVASMVLTIVLKP